MNYKIYKVQDMTNIGLAIMQFEKALSINENQISSRFHLGQMYHRIHKFDEALKCFSKVLLKIRDDQTAYIARG
jgi:tetratricopeptide (TPR) repeat protein